MTFDQIVEYLASSTHDPDIAPSLKKDGGFMVGGNTPHLMPLYADKFGRVWREDRNTLVLIPTIEQVTVKS